MTGDEPRAPSLRRAFASLAEVAGDGSRCPESERLWASAWEEVDRRENEELILHLGECTACAAAWRLARELSHPETVQDTAPFPAERQPAPRRASWVSLAAAAVLIAIAGALLVPRFADRTIEQPVYRSQEGRWLESAFEPGAVLPREACVLRWAAGPEGTVYELLVTTATLRPLARASRLERPEYRVAEEPLAELSTGERILWRVTARLPDGRRVVSRTFVTAIQ